MSHGNIDRRLTVMARPAVAAVLVLAMAGCGGRAEPKKDSKAQQGQSVSVALVANQALPRVINASGTISAWEEVPVGAETGGLTAVQVNTDEGQIVRQGQVLVKLNDAVLSAQLRQQVAAVNSARATNAEAEAALRRSQQLNKQGYLSQASLDTALARQQSTAAQVVSAQAAQGEIEARLAQTAIRAPVSGLIIRRSVTKGQIVTAGAELFRLVRDNRLELDAQIPETELPLVKAGMPATVASGPAGAASGAVRIVTSEVDEKTRLGLARVALSAPGAFRPGMFARAQIQAGDQLAATVPSAAVLYRENHAGVFVLDPRNKAHFRRVTILTRVGDRTATTGLIAGERVVVEGSGFLGEGDQVRIGTAPAAAGRAG